MSGPRSAALYERACRVLPGGVNSPVRAFRAVGGAPIVFERGRGVELVDVDGRVFDDYVLSWGPLLLGHAHPEVVDAIARAARDGTSFGAPCRHEIELAERVTSMLPWLELVRFVSSGTEATMSALRVARGATGRELVLKFSGCYHGHADALLVDAGSGLATFGHPSSAGVPAAFAERTLVLPLDDEQRLADLFEREGARIAAAIVEPVPGNHGLLLQRPQWLRLLRELCTRHGAVLVFDEVMSGFRVARGGAVELYGIRPDLATYGKVIGGGLPVGAFGGRADLMRQLAPLGPVYQAGTLSGNPVAMAAGLKTLEVLERERAWQRIEVLSAALERALAPVLAAAPQPVQLVRCGSKFWLSLQAGAPPRSAACVSSAAAARYKPLHASLLAAGIYLAPSAYEVGFLSILHTGAHFERLAAALARALSAECAEVRT
ncbi:MAG: glutamate-1-semialdehyde 2,1-aminomutase [Planctomycetota bacterium]|nr:MAG: glutamate-1-semialdehyde 2,1-aminomutase [Planctomycetota bacterium]